MILRAEQNTVYQLVNGKEIVYFSFDVDVGDIVIFEGSPYLVKKIEIWDVFDERANVYTIVNVNSRPDTIVQYSFSRKFGLLGYHRTYLNYVETSNMIGAIIKGTRCVRLWD
jgi:hypothetical protein